MYKNFLGIGAGLALGVSLFAAPAFATTALVLDDASIPLEGDNTHVGEVDWFLGACLASGGGLQVEIDCINGWQNDFDFTVADAEGGMMDFDTITDPFLDVGTLQTVVEGEDVFENVFVTEPDTYAISLSKSGGWFSVKTGNISCEVGTFYLDANLDDAYCDGTEKQFFLIFENHPLLSYGVFDLGLSGLEGEGFFLTDIYKFSHITIVPLPAAAFLFGSALLGGGLMRRRKMVKKFGLPAA